METDNLNVKNEELVLKIVGRWIEADSNRNKFLPDLLRAVRLEQLSTESLLTLEDWAPGRFPFDLDPIQNNKYSIF